MNKKMIQQAQQMQAKLISLVYKKLAKKYGNI